MMRKILQFNTMSDVFVRAVILTLIISILAGLIVNAVGHIFVSHSDRFVNLAYFVGAGTGVVVGAPIVLFFFYAAKIIYGDHLEVARIAREDFLTGLLNRREFFSKIAHQSDGQNGPVLFTRVGMLLIIDADNFKRINDVYGHLVGDSALVAIATTIKKSVRDIDIAARIGGEEFGVFLPNVCRVSGLEIAERVRAAVADIVLIVGSERLLLNISIGANIVDCATPVSLAMKEADAALYAAKSQGKNCVFLAGDSRDQRLIRAELQAA